MDGRNGTLMPHPLGVPMKHLVVAAIALALSVPAFAKTAAHNTKHTAHHATATKHSVKKTGHKAHKTTAHKRTRTPKA